LRTTFDNSIQVQTKKSQIEKGYINTKVSSNFILSCLHHMKGPQNTLLIPA